MSDPRDAFDSVYFLTFGGWKGELQSNRWHYASRWARELPVVLVEPVGISGVTSVELDSRLPNLQLLSVPRPTYVFDAGWQCVATARIVKHMQAHNHWRPLLWAYNPNLLGAYAAVPAVARVYHASENYFAYEGLPDSFLEALEAMISVSDLTVAVSSGVARAFADRIPLASIECVPNGCEFHFYAH